VLAIKEINRGFDFQAEFAANFGGCVSRLSGGACLAPKLLRASRFCSRKYHSSRNLSVVA
jgi:hypothetical protein